MRNYLFTSVIICLFACTGCSHKEAEEKPLKILTVALKTASTPLYFNGIMEPTKTYNVSSTVDGTIAEMHFHYGESIKKGQLLLVLDSPQLAADYQAALTDYLKTKREKTNHQIQLRNTEELKKLGLISDDDYRNNIAQAHDVVLSFEQATAKLQAVLRKMGISAEHIEKMDIGNLQVVHAALSQPVEKLKIFAPDNGVALLPEKSSNSTGSSEEPLKLGSQVKAGQSLLMVGDMTGIGLAVKVNEVNINTIKLKQAAIVTSDAIAGLTLQGYVDHVAEQAVSNDSGGLPSFLVHIKVPQLTEQQRKQIRVGMSAKIELLMQETSQIKVPLSAVIVKQDKSFVKVINEKNGEIKLIAITPGQTTLDSVEVQAGLRPGDKVIVDAAHE